jgi:hypothetical protein
MEYNGGSIVAMIGKDCVAIASDLRLGQQAIGVAMNFDKVCPCPCWLEKAFKPSSCVVGVCCE